MNILDALREAGIPFREHGESTHVTEGWVGIDCVFCGKGSGRFHLGINLAGLYASCWKCGSHRLGEVFRELTGEWPRWLADLDRERPRTAKSEGTFKFPEGLIDLTSSDTHVWYLRARGFKNVKRLSQFWGLKATRVTNRIPWSIFIPIHYQGEIVSWTTRSLCDHGRRYRTAKRSEEKIPAKSLLYGEDHARHAIIVVEGPLDVWRIGPGAVATMGLAFTPTQVERISKYPVRVICLDSEQEAQRRAYSLCRQLECFPGRTINVMLESGKDASRANPEEVAKLRRYLT